MVKEIVAKLLAGLEPLLVELLMGMLAHLQAQSGNAAPSQAGTGAGASQG